MWSHLTLRDHDLNKVDSTLPEDAYSQVQDFLVFEKIVQDFLYTCILIMSRGDNEDELYVMMIIILHGNYFNATVKRFGGDNF